MLNQNNRNTGSINHQSAFLLIIVAAVLFSVIDLSAQVTGGPGDLWAAKWKGDKKAALAITFDDGYLSQFENARPILNQFGLKASFYVMPDFLTDSLPGIWRYGTWAMFQAMSLEGHEIGSHSLTHPHMTELEAGDTLTPGTILYELYFSKAKIDNRITNQECITFAYPFAEHNRLVDSLTSLVYESARANGDTINPASPGFEQWYSLSAMEVIFDEPRNSPEDDLDELTELQNWIDSLISTGKWSTLLGHEVVPFDSIQNTPTRYPYSNEWFTGLCSWLKLKSDEQKLWIETLGNITKYIRERDSYSYEVLAADENSINLRLTDNLNDEIYNYPLTVFIKVPGNWNYALLLQGDRVDTLTAFTNDSGRVVLADIIPDGGEVSLYRMNITSVEDDVIANNFVLYQNYPNPFNPSTKIKFTIQTAGASLLKFAQLKVYDILGKEVATLINKQLTPGDYEVKFNAAGLPSGVYFYRLYAGEFSAIKKMLLLK